MTTKISKQIKFTCPNCGDNGIKKIETRTTIWNDVIFKNGDIKRSAVSDSSNNVVKYQCCKCVYVIVPNTNDDEYALWKALLKLTT